MAQQAPVPDDRGVPRRRDPNRPPVDEAALAALLARQSGVVGSRDLKQVGAGKPDLDRMVRSRRLVRVRRGVFVDHTGPLSCEQAHWAAVLAIPRSVLADECALAAARVREGVHGHGPQVPVQVAVEGSRHVATVPGVDCRYVSGLADKALWNTSPPRLKPEHAALRVASRAPDDVSAVAALTDALGARLTTADRLRAGLSAHPSLRRRAWLTRVVNDLASGTNSVLEHGYLDLVERPHGLPPSTRQAVRRTSAGVEYRDVEYEEFGVVVEMDGRAFHGSATARERDYERELDDRVAARETVRLAWGQVYRHSCRTAGKIGTVLARRGWTGRPTNCGPDCGLAA